MALELRASEEVIYDLLRNDATVVALVGASASNPRIYPHPGPEGTGNAGAYVTVAYMRSRVQNIAGARTRYMVRATFLVRCWTETSQRSAADILADAVDDALCAVGASTSKVYNGKTYHVESVGQDQPLRDEDRVGDRTWRATGGFYAIECYRSA